MLTAKAFRALRYDFKKISLSDAVCPPYDVIRGPLDARLRKGKHNAVHIELPRGTNPYKAAAGIFEKWRKAGILIAEDSPSFYVVEQAARVRGVVKKRSGVLAALGLDKATASRVLRHERTLSKHKKDRQKLIRAVKANTSPIFGVFADKSGAVNRLLAKAQKARPLAVGRDSAGLPIRLWRVENPVAVAALEKLLSKETLLIADGHHRYSVGCEHRAASRETGAGRLLAFLVSERDPGLVVLPTHRVVEGTPALRRALSRACRARPVKDYAALAAALPRERSPYAMGLVDGRSCAVLTPAAGDKGVKSGFATDWLFRRLLSRVDPHDIAYFPEAGEAVAEARRSGRLALLLKDFAVGDIRKAVLKAGLLPQKSTYFYPKIPTGLVFRSFALDP